MRKVTLTLTILFATACIDEESLSFRSEECTIVDDEMVVDHSAEGFDIEPPRDCTGEVYLDVDDLTFNSTDGTGLEFGVEDNGWREVTIACPSTGCWGSKPKKIWIKTTPICCTPLTGCNPC